MSNAREGNGEPCHAEACQIPLILSHQNKDQLHQTLKKIAESFEEILVNHM